MMADYLVVRTEHRDGLCLLRIAGELDAISARGFAEHAVQVTRRAAGPVLVDLSGLSFIDVAGARALDAVISAIPAGRLAGVRFCQPPVRRVLDMLGACLPERAATSGEAGARRATFELVDRVQQARLHASVAKYDASAVVASVAETGRRVGRTCQRSIRTRQQGRLIRAQARLARRARA